MTAITEINDRIKGSKTTSNATCQIFGPETQKNRSGPEIKHGRQSRLSWIIHRTKVNLQVEWQDWCKNQYLESTKQPLKDKRTVKTVTAEPPNYAGVGLAWEKDIGTSILREAWRKTLHSRYWIAGDMQMHQIWFGIQTTNDWTSLKMSRMGRREDRSCWRCKKTKGHSGSWNVTWLLDSYCQFYYWQQS